MKEENMMHDAGTQTFLSESAFSGMSEDSGRSSVSQCVAAVVAKAYLVQGTGNVRFNLWKPSLEARTGVKIERGRMYVVRGRIEGVGEFESRHVGSANPHVYVFFREGEGKVVPGERYLLLVEAIEEKRWFEVLPSSRGPCIRVTRPVLEGLGVRTEERSVVELVLRRAGEESGGRRAYAQWEPDWGFMQLYLRSAGMAEGETVQVVGGGGYPLERFVTDFQSRKAPEIANVELGVDGGGLGIRVDGKGVPVEKYWLGTHSLKAVLKVKLGQDRRMLKFESDGERCEARLMNSDRIVGLRVNEKTLEIGYARTATLVYRTRPSEFDGGGLRESEIFDRMWTVEKPATVDGEYTLRMDDDFCRLVRHEIDETKSSDAYRTLRGNVSERVVRHLVPAMGLEFLADHPRSQEGPELRSRRRGPDFLVRSVSSGEVFYVEVKWWRDVSRAQKDGTRQARWYCEKNPECRGHQVVGAYIAVLDWNITSVAKMHVIKMSR